LRIDWKQKLENCSGKLCGGMVIIPWYGAISFGFSAGRLKGPEIKFGPLVFKCLSKMILFMVLANSKFTSLRRVVVSDELLPLSYFVF
jgi:hypothetical protein